jgi:transposase
MQRFLSLKDLAARIGRSKSTAHRQLRRWERETGGEILVGRAGGHPRFLLKADDAANFAEWFDAPRPRH